MATAELEQGCIDPIVLQHGLTPCGGVVWVYIR